MNKKISFAITVFAVCVLTFSVVFVGSFLFIAITDKETWNQVKNEYLEKEDTVDKAANQDLGNILTGTVELTINKEFINFLSTEDESFDYTLTQEQKDNGFIDIKKNDDGSATYTVKKKDYKKFISELKETAKQGIDELTKDGSLSSVKSITYNDDLSKIVIIAEKENFEESFDSLAVMSCGLSSCMYQMFDINAPGKCTVEVKDAITNEVFRTTVYPDAMNDE